jgi:large subunit ribosomal protein L22
MEIYATHKNARMSPQKLRPLSRILRGLPVESAKMQLEYFPGKAAVILSEVLKSAVANATHNYSLEAKNLVVHEIRISQGFVMKRFMPVSRGMAHPIMKRTAHVTVVVSEAGAKKTALKGKKSDIATISAQEFANLCVEEAHDHDHEETVPEKTTGGKGNLDVRTEEVKKDKSMGVSSKQKSNQQGGDPKKTYRRKSMVG